MPIKFWNEEPEEDTPIDDLVEKEKLSPDGFKVGDWVVVLPEDKYYDNAEQDCAQQIVQIYHDLFDYEHGLPYKLRFRNGTTNSYHKVRAATEDEIEKAQIKPNEPVTAANRYIGMRVKPGPNWDTTLSHCKEEFKKGTIDLIDYTANYPAHKNLEDYVRVKWDDSKHVYWYRTGKRLGGSNERYELSVSEE